MERNNAGEKRSHEQQEAIRYFKTTALATPCFAVLVCAAKRSSTCSFHRNRKGSSNNNRINTITDQKDVRAWQRWNSTPQTSIVVSTKEWKQGQAKDVARNHRLPVLVQTKTSSPRRSSGIGLVVRHPRPLQLRVLIRIQLPGAFRIPAIDSLI